MGLSWFGDSNYTDSQWYNEPRDRGTWSLVHSCVITLGLCVYTALHLNVFNPEVRYWTRWRICLKWVFVALLIPEFIVFNAWLQRRLAVKIVKQLHGPRTAPGTPKPALEHEDGAPPLRVDQGQHEPEAPVEFTLDADVEAKPLPPNTASLQASRPSAELDRLPNPPPWLKRVLHEIWHGYLTWRRKYYRKNPPRSKAEKYGLKHGFFIAMGGLVIDRSRIEGTILNGRLVLPSQRQDFYIYI